jgi:hypothetical protein
VVGESPRGPKLLFEPQVEMTTKVVASLFWR